MCIHGFSLGLSGRSEESLKDWGSILCEALFFIGGVDRRNPSGTPRSQTSPVRIAAHGTPLRKRGRGGDNRKEERPYGQDQRKIWTGQERGGRDPELGGVQVAEGQGVC